MNTRPKKQHHVPCLVLKRFAGNDPVGMVWTYDKQDTEGKSPRPSLPAETAAQTNLHTIFGDDGKPNDAVEHWLMKVESSAEKIYVNLHEGEIPTGADRIYFSQFVATLYARSPAMRRIYGEIMGGGVERKMNALTANKERFKEHMERYRKEIGGDGVADLNAMFDFITDKSKYKVQIDLQATIRALELSDDLLDIFNAMSWAVLSTPVDRPFIIGDFPVVRSVQPDTRHAIHGDGGFINKTAVVSLPLSPTRLLQMTWDSKDVPRLVPADRELVKIFNRGRAYFAERFLYADRRDEGIRRLAVKHNVHRLEMSMSGAGNFAEIEVKRKIEKRDTQDGV